MGKKRNNEYEFKEVLAYKRQGKIEYFLVWWQGYPKREATWEPVTNLQDVDGYDEYYNNLKQSYDNNLRKKVNHAKPAQKTPTLSKQDKQSQSEKQRKSKKIHKAVRELRSNSKNNHQQSRSVNQQELMQEVSASYQQEEIIDESSASPQIQRPDKKAIEEKARLKRLLNSAPAVKFQIKIKQFKQLPFLGQKIKQIKQTFTRNGKTMYEVQLADSKAMTQPVIMHQNFIKVVWPKQFASYLLSKQRT